MFDFSTVLFFTFSILIVLEVFIANWVPIQTKTASTIVWLTVSNPQRKKKEELSHWLKI